MGKNGPIKEFRFEEVYAVYSTTEQGGASDQCFGFFSDEDTADVIAAGKGAYGEAGAVIRKEAIVIVYEHGAIRFLVESRDEVAVDIRKEEEFEKIRTAAAKKLSEAERVALGIT